MATFTALAKIFSINVFCSTKVAGLDEIFIQQKFSRAVNREYFIVKLFSDSLAYAKIKRKYMRNINNNAVQGH